MRRAALLLALLVSVPVAAGAPAADTPSTAPPGDDPPSVDPTNVLVLPEPSRAGITTVSLDVPTSVALQREAAAGRLERYTLDARLRDAADDADRRRTLLVRAGGTRTRSAALWERERAVRAAYANGSIDTGTFLRRLVRLNARAGNLRLYLDRLEAGAERTPGFSLRGRLGAVEARLVGFRGPVDARVRDSVLGTAAPTRFYVEASGRGAALSAVADGRYVREAYRTDRRSEDGESIGLDRVVRRVQTLYPTMNDTVLSVIQGLGGGSTWVYRTTFDLDDGSLVAYLDGGTEEVFYEVRDRDLDAVAGSRTAGNTANGTRLVVNRSYPGGPLRIATYDDATGEPVGATVVVAGARLETGADGVAWALTPRTGRFTVTAVRPAGNVSTFVRPIEPPALNTSA